MGKGSMTKESAWMAFWGLLFLFCGSQKLVDIIDTQGHFRGEYDEGTQRLPTGILVAGAIAEISYGFVGVVLGLLYLTYGKENPLWTQFSLAMQCLGIYTFTVFVVVQPAWDSQRLPDNFHYSGFDKTKYRGLITDSIIGMAMYQLSLHLALFFSTIDFYSQQSKSQNMLSARASGFVFNLVSLIAALCAMAIGARIYNFNDTCKEYKCGSLLEPIYLLPFPVVWPALLIVAGAFQIVVAITGIVRLAIVDGKQDTAGGFSYFSLLSILAWMILLGLILIPNLGVDWTQQMHSWWARLVPLVTAMCLAPLIYDAKYMTGKDYNTRDFL